MSLPCSSLGAEPGPASDRATFSGLSPIHPFSASDSSESIAPESIAWRGASTPRGAGVAVGSGVGGLAGVATQAEASLYLGNTNLALNLYRRMLKFEAEPWQYASTALQAGQIASKLEDSQLADEMEEIFAPRV